MSTLAETVLPVLPPLAVVPRITERRSLLKLAKRLRTDLTVLYENERFYHDDVVERRSLFTKFVVALNPELIRHVMVTNADNYQRGTMTKNTVRAWAGDGVLTSEGDAWRAARKVLEPWFRRKTMDHFTQPIIDATNRLLRQVEEGRHGQSLERLSVEEFATTLSTTIIAETLFSSDIDDKLEPLHRELTEIQREMTRIKLSDLLGIGRFFTKRYSARTMSTLNNLKQIFDPIIADRRVSEEKKHDYLQEMLDLKPNSDGTPRLTEKQIYDNLFSIFLGAPESVSYSLVWTLYLLSRHPDAQNKIHAELTSVVGDRDTRPDDLPKLSYMWAALQEAMRLYPPVHSFTRQAVADDMFEGISIPRGSTVFFPVYAIHRHEKLWTEPNAYRPERFMQGNRTGKDDIFSFLAFSTGPRFCVGRPLAEFELKLVLSILIRRFHIVARADGGNVGLKGLVTLRPTAKIFVALEPR